LLIGLIGLSRIYLGVHHASDVLAGYAAAIVWISAVTMIVRQRKEV
jgi:undecaprenyl-diphosphatase